jgi:hypothetical protein
MKYYVFCTGGEFPCAYFFSSEGKAFIDIGLEMNHFQDHFIFMNNMKQDGYRFFNNNNGRLSAEEVERYYQGGSVPTSFLTSTSEY